MRCIDNCSIFPLQMDGPKIEALQKGDSVWSLSNIPLLEEYLSVMEDDPLKDVVQAVIDKFKTDVQPKLNFFRKGETPVGVFFFFKSTQHA